MIGRVLGKLSEEMDWDAMARFVQQRRARGETVDVGTFRGNVPPGNVELLEAFINRFETYLGDDFRGYYEEWRRTAVDLEFRGQRGPRRHVRRPQRCGGAGARRRRRGRGGTRPPGTRAQGVR